jgi:phospholipid/cholesterol/gamma-HCH transport system permease protein
LTAVMLAGRVGGSLTAELGTMKVTEQIDAMRAMAADPIRALVVPRFLACILMLPLLTIFSDALGMAGGWFIAVRVFGVDQADYWNYSRRSFSGQRSRRFRATRGLTAGRGRKGWVRRARMRLWRRL